MELYQIKDDYISFLQKYDAKVLNNVGPKYNTSRKHIWISVTEFNGIKYYLPLSSPKKSDYESGTLNVKPSTLTIKRLVDSNGKLLGKVLLADMLPVPKEALIKYDVNSEKDYNYKRLVQKEINIIKKIKHKIIKDALVVYKIKISNTNKYNWEKACCNFALLEKECQTYTSK